MALARGLCASILALSLLSACGGGGGGDGGGNTGGGGTLDASPTSIVFSADVNGAAPPFQNISIQPTSDAWDVVAGYPAGTPSASWLSMSFTDARTLRLSVGNTSLSEGTRTTTVRIATRRITGETIAYRDIAVSYTLNARLQISSNALDFDMITGGTVPSAQAVSLSGGTLAWTASADQPWVSLSVASGTSPGSTFVSVSPSGLAEGQHRATITFTETRSGRTLPLAVTFNVNPRRLIVSDNGVALTSAPSAVRLSETIRVRDNTGSTSSWTASSDQTWLAVTSSGTTDNDVVLTADPTGLAPNMYYATVTISSATPGIQSDTVRVGFYVQSAATATQPVNVSSTHRIADPIRPFVYVANSSDGTVNAYNIYSGASSTITIGGSLTTMEISSDGSYLYVYNQVDQNVVVIDLDTGAEVNRWLAPNVYPYPVSLHYIRPNGQPILATTTAVFVDPADGQVRGSMPSLGQMFAFLPATDSRYALIYSTFGGLQRVIIDYSDHGQALRLRATHSLQSPPLAGTRLGANADASKLYVTTGGNTLTTYVLSGSSFVPGTPAPANSGNQLVHKGSRGKTYYSAWRILSTYELFLWTYGPNDTVAESYSTTANDRSDIAISGDGLRALIMTGSQFIPWAIGP